MKKYADVNGDSGVSAYEEGPDFIRVVFKDGAVYQYTNASAGPEKIAQMKALASDGDGLNSYINKYVRKLYAMREK